MRSFENIKWVHHKKTPNFPSKRWGHTAAILNNQIYIYGGKLEHESKKYNECFYSLNCEDYEFERLDQIKSPELRDSHICFVVQNILYIWGGCINQKPHVQDVAHSVPFLIQETSQCFKFDGKDWRVVEQHGKIPSSRQSSISTVIKNRYLLMYGGCTEEQVFGDFHVFDIKKRMWHSIKILGQTMPVLENATLTLINNQLFLFGGQSTIVPMQMEGGLQTAQKKEIYHNDLYLLELTVVDFENAITPPSLIVTKIKTGNKPPVERSNHCAVGYQNRYLIILAGETYSKIDRDEVDLLNDIWYYEIHMNLWKEMKPSGQNIFKKHSNFSAVLFGEEIVVFGGLKSIEQLSHSDQLLTLRLYDVDSYKDTNICSVCQLIYRGAMLTEENPQENPEYQSHSCIKEIKSNIRTVYKTAQLIDHPFDAFKLLIEGAIIAKATRIHISLQLIQQKLMLTITDNSHRMGKSEFQWMICNNLTQKSESFYDTEGATSYSYTKSLTDYGKFLKYGGFKLGNSIFTSHLNDDGEMFSLLSNSAVHYYFMKFNRQKECYELGQKNEELNDFEIMRPLIKLLNSEPMLVKNYSTRRVIYDLKAEDDKSLYTFENKHNDIWLKKKYPFELKQLYAGEFESLRQYISTMFLEPVNLSICINNKEVIKLKSYSGFYSFFRQDRISDCKLQSTTGLEFSIYYKPMRFGNEIKIFRNNILIKTSTRFKNGKYTGYVIVPLSWQPNMFHTGFESDSEFIEDAIEYIIKAHEKSLQLAKAAVEGSSTC